MMAGRHGIKGLSRIVLVEDMLHLPDEPSRHHVIPSVPSRMNIGQAMSHLGMAARTWYLSTPIDL